MNTLPTISIVTPSYNQAAFVRETLDSVLDQHYPALEYGVCDGQSTDGSIDIINAYRDRLAFAIIEPDHGQVDAINKGLARCTGEIVTFLNSDDTLLAGSLEAVGRFFAEHPDEDWLVGHCVQTQCDGAPIETLVAAPPRDLAHILIRDEPIEMPQPAVFFRRRLLDELGVFRDHLHFAFDFEMWCRMLAAGYRPRAIDQPLATYRLHETSKTCTLAARFLSEHLAIEPGYAKLLERDQRYLFRRIHGYRLRQHVVLTATARPWREVLARPWWLGSQQIVRLLVQGPQRIAA